MAPTLSLLRHFLRVGLKKLPTRPNYHLGSRETTKIQKGVHFAQLSSYGKLMLSRDVIDRHVKTNEFRIETMYIYHTAMEIYVLDCTIIFSPFYCLCITSMPHHSPTMN